MPNNIASKIIWNIKKRLHNGLGASEQEDHSNLPTIFHLTHHKSGSQWIRQVLTSVAPSRSITPLPLAKHITDAPIAQGKIYPTVYLTKKDLDEHINGDVADNYKQFFVLRDLRDTLVSLYFSLKYSHKVVSENVRKQKEILKDLSDSEGMSYLLEHSLHVQNDIQMSWITEDILCLRYEEMLDDPHKAFRSIFSYCEIEVPEDELNRVIELHSFKSMTGGRDPGKEDKSQHQRKGIAGDWKNHFDDALKDKFKEKFGQTLIATGYEKDLNW